MPPISTNKEKLLVALRKAKTSIEKILAEVEAEGKNSECFPIIQQNLAVIGLLKSANLLMLENHMNKKNAALFKSASSKQVKEFQQEILKIVRMSQNK